MPMPAADIEAMIKESFPDARVEIRDLAGDGDHYGSQGTSQSRMKGRDVAFVALNLYGYPHGTGGGTCKGCKRGLRYIDLGIEYPLSHCQRRRVGTRLNIVGRTSGHQRW